MQSKKKSYVPKTAKFKEKLLKKAKERGGRTRKDCSQIPYILLAHVLVCMSEGCPGSASRQNSKDVEFGFHVSLKCCLIWGNCKATLSQMLSSETQLSILALNPLTNWDRWVWEFLHGLDSSWESLKLSCVSFWGYFCCKKQGHW